MSNKSDLRKQEALRAQSAALAAESATDRASAREEGEVSKRLTAETTGWFDFLKNPARDYSKFLPVTAGLVEEGEAGAEVERTALGSAQFGAAGADPNLQAVLKANAGERKVQRRGKALENAVMRYDTIMRAQAGDVAAQDQARRMGSASLTTGASSSATNSYASFSPRPHWGMALAAGGVAALGSAFTPRAPAAPASPTITPASNIYSGWRL